MKRPLSIPIRKTYFYPRLMRALKAVDKLTKKSKLVFGMILLLALPVLAGNGPLPNGAKFANGDFVADSNTVDATYYPRNDPSNYASGGGASDASTNYFRNAVNSTNLTAAGIVTNTALLRHQINTNTLYLMETNFVHDSKVRALVLPSYVPITAQALQLDIVSKCDAAARYFAFCSVSNALTEQNLKGGCRIPWANSTWSYNVLVPIGNPGTLWYYSELSGTDGSTRTLFLTISGWWIP